MTHDLKKKGFSQTKLGHSDQARILEDFGPITNGKGNRTVRILDFHIDTVRGVIEIPTDYWTGSPRDHGVCVKRDGQHSFD